MILNCIAIDDEPPALNLLKRFIDQTPFLSLAAGFANAVDGLRFITENPVDVVFLDIQMPDLTGIELVQQLSELPQAEKPAIVFITAYEEFAMEGFRLNVADYLLKPFNYRDFLRAANRCLSWYEMKTKALGNAVPEEHHIFLRVNHQSVRVNTSEISYIEGLKDYARIHFVNPNKKMLSLITLKALEEKLPAGKFMRIHKSFIVSLANITSITKNAVQIGQVTIPVSAPFKPEFEVFAGKWR